jgi:hypothetical protein
MTKPEAKAVRCHPHRTPAKDVPATHGLGIGHSDIPSSFGFRHSSFRTSSGSIENLKEAE